MTRRGTRSSSTATPAPAEDSTATATPAPAPVDSTATPTPAPAEEPVDSTPDPVDTFTARWVAALADRDTSTGTVPAALLNAVGDAFRAIPSRKRPAAVLASTDRDTAEAMAGGPMGLGDPGPEGAARRSLLAASAALAEHLRSLGTAPAASAVTDEDRAHALSVALFSVAGDAHREALAPVLAAVLGTDTAGLGALATWAADDSTEADAGIKRVRAALKAVSGRGSARTGASTATGTGRRTNGAGTVAQHVRAALEANGGEPMTHTAIRKAVTEVYPETDTRPSGGAIASVSDSAAEAVGIEAVTVDGAKGWALSA